METICITGASAGIGWASALTFAKRYPKNLHFMLGARRADRLGELADLITEKYGNPVSIQTVDLADESSIKLFADQTINILGKVDILFNNAGGAHGNASVVDADPQDWRTMMDVNFYGTLMLTRHLLPDMIRRESGHIINLGSIAGSSVYEGGSVYCASKHALQALTKTLKLELNGKGIRVTSIDPGLVETEFSMVRFKGDAERAKKVYSGMTPLTAEDIAECVLFAASAPKHVNIDQIMVTPTDQATVYKVHRR